MNLSSQSTKIGRTGVYAGPSGFWSQSRNRHWVHTLSHRAVVTSITEYTSVMARSCTLERGPTERWQTDVDHVRLIDDKNIS